MALTIAASTTAQAETLGKAEDQLTPDMSTGEAAERWGIHTRNPVVDELVQLVGKQVEAIGQLSELYVSASEGPRPWSEREARTAALYAMVLIGAAERGVGFALSGYTADAVKRGELEPYLLGFVDDPKRRDNVERFLVNGLGMGTETALAAMDAALIYAHGGK